MHKVALGAVVVAFGALIASGVYAQNMSLTSADVSNGGAIKDEQVLSAEYGFGCKGDNISPSLELERGAERDQELRHHQLRSGCADRQRLVALGGVQHSGRNHVDPEERRRRQGQAHARGRHSEPDRFRYRRLDGGPCPPADGTSHRYIFTVFAVDEEKLQYAKDHNASAALVGFELHFHTLAKASLVGMYGRPAEKK